MKTREAKSVVVVAAAALLGLAGGPARAEQRGSLSKDDAVLVVDGVVREVFRSQRRDRVDYLVQIEVKRSEVGRTPREPVRVLVPAPGDQVYIHASDPQAAAQNLAGGREPAAGGRRVVPSERSQVKAYLVPGAPGAAGKGRPRTGSKRPRTSPWLRVRRTRHRPLTSHRHRHRRHRPPRRPRSRH